ncbi:MAG TPA: DUF4388 domain-containing protein [Polyangiaceae bacterium]|nr:DUF4388 domain-containing protein [Polyangiaceae bacterium]
MDSQLEATWSEEQKSRLIARIVGGELTVKGACDQYQLSPEELVAWASIYRRSAHDAIDQQLAQVLASQGIEAPSLKAAEFSGTLGDLSIADLTQTIAVGRKDAIVTIAHAGCESQLWFERGELIDAESAALRGVPAAYRILALDEGSLSARFHRGERDRNIYTSLARLLLEAARRKDESQVLKKFVGESDFIYVQIPGASTQVAKNPSEIATIALFDGTRTLAEVLAASALGDLETLQLTARLLEQDYLMLRGRRNAERTTGESEPARIVAKMTVLQLTRVRADKWWRRARARGAPALGLALIAAAVISPRGAPSSAAECAPESRDERAARARAGELVRAGAAPARELFVDLQPEPSDAEVWLDGKLAGTGPQALRLARDGRLHEVRVSAEGYVSQTLLFTDRPPAGRVALSPLAADHARAEGATLETASSAPTAPALRTSIAAPTLVTLPSQSTSLPPLPRPRLLPLPSAQSAGASPRELVAADLPASPRERPHVRLLE